MRRRHSPRFFPVSILGYFPLNLFADALPNRVDPASGGGMGSSAQLHSTI